MKIKLKVNPEIETIGPDEFPLTITDGKKEVLVPRVKLGDQYDIFPEGKYFYVVCWSEKDLTGRISVFDKKLKHLYCNTAYYNDDDVVALGLDGYDVLDILAELLSYDFISKGKRDSRRSK